MNARTEHFILSFDAPFTLNAVDTVLPGGDQAIDQDERLIDGISRLACQRVATFIYLPPISARQTKTQVVSVNPSELSTDVRRE